MQKAVFELEPLACPSCINHIENTLNTTKGIYSASVSFSSKRVETQFDEKQIEVKQIEEVISELGYPVLLAK
ncbi:heavy-metal-associated domain-containing protein [Oceanobacillus salinisoli]|uniref:heavy-metal-associated domain-containing protein n=1 Tax=Oceanobacillus salinisoli TaxID=2678611 RepID=UPI0012E1D63C|nr:heavy-metal-associated domain-containing protein [Oceanobacillus salinisoli]